MASPILEQLLRVAATDRIAVREFDTGRTASYGELVDGILRAKATLAGDGSLDGRRVVLLCSPGVDWVTGFLGVLAAGGACVPLSPLYPDSELLWFAQDAAADLAIVSSDLESRVGRFPSKVRLLRADLLTASAKAKLSTLSGAACETATFLYTSGTTGKPKGAEVSHLNLASQSALLREAWGYSEHEHLLHALPLHHLHGLSIALLSMLLAGKTITMMTKFDAEEVWKAIARRSVTTWMAVPTMYQRLLETYERAGADKQREWARGAAELRLSTSGSAALPVTLAERWQQLAGAIPLERYGMTEIGVGMSNPLDPSSRRAGTVGFPLPSVEAKLVENGVQQSDGPAELYIRGPSVFKGYFGLLEATNDAFDGDWFKTGDVATRSPDGYYRLLGRTSVDILKSGGYKISALEIEESLREHEAILEVAVVGIPDEAWGERVVAAIVCRAGDAQSIHNDRLRAWAKERLAVYKVPREFIVLPALPRNALGKVVKPKLIRMLSGDAPKPVLQG